jgi:hypothetical protein
MPFAFVTGPAGCFTARGAGCRGAVGPMPEDGSRLPMVTFATAGVAVIVLGLDPPPHELFHGAAAFIPPLTLSVVLGPRTR